MKARLKKRTGPTGISLTLGSFDAISFNLYVFPPVNLSSLYCKLLYSKSIVCGLEKPAQRYYKSVVFLDVLALRRKIKWQLHLQT